MPSRLFGLRFPLPPAGTAGGGSPGFPGLLCIGLPYRLPLYDENSVFLPAINVSVVRKHFIFLAAGTVYFLYHLTEV